MKILAIESSALVASAALYEDGIIRAICSTNFKKTHSQTLMPMIDQVVKMTETDLESLDAIAVSGGPGSFTGLRIGCAAAKGLGLALDKPLIHVPTLDAMAYNFCACRELIVPVMDARRNQVYTGIYTFKEEEGRERLEILLENSAMDIKELLLLIKTGFFSGEKEKRFHRAVFLGDGVPVFKDAIKTAAEFEYTFASPAQCYQSAASLAVLAAEYFTEGKIIPADAEKPVYLRPSQAERVKAEKEGRA